MVGRKAKEIDENWNGEHCSTGSNKAEYGADKCTCKKCADNLHEAIVSEKKKAP
jgi:hypothetical protein